MAGDPWVKGHCHDDLSFLFRRATHVYGGFTYHIWKTLGDVEETWDCFGACSNLGRKRPKEEKDDEDDDEQEGLYKQYRIFS